LGTKSQWSVPSLDFEQNYGNVSLNDQHPPSERAPVPLAMHHTPFCLTFAYFPDESIPAVLDPSHLEQRLSAGLMTVALNAQRELCVVQKAGGVPLESDEMMRIIDIAVGKAKELDNLIETRLKEDWGGRTVEVR
jgi:exosome complex component RRP45